MEGYRVPFQDAESEFTEKRSRFISNLWRVESEAEARAKIEGIRKARYDARHHCWCYLIQEGGAVRYSDDGEPQGTAGQPMLNVFQREGVTNVCCVVTRYFGGILLGGGMVHNKDLVEQITRTCSFIAPVTAYPGEFEMEAMAAGAARVLDGEEELKHFTGKKVWEKFDFE